MYFIYDSLAVRYRALGASISFILYRANIHISTHMLRNRKSLLPQAGYLGRRFDIHFY